MFDQCQYEFKNFDVPNDLMAFIKSVIERVQNLSPSNAFLKTHIFKNGSKFEGEIHVNSQATTFKAIAHDADPRELIMKLGGQIQNQLKNWKKFRFIKGDHSADL